MRLTRNKPVSEINDVEARPTTSRVGTVFAYCPNCGDEIREIFSPGDFVLVSEPGQRRYYGRLLSLNREDKQVMAKIEINSVETAKVNASSLRSVRR